MVLSAEAATVPCRTGSVPGALASVPGLSALANSSEMEDAHGAGAGRRKVAFARRKRSAEPTGSGVAVATMEQEQEQPQRQDKRLRVADRLTASGVWPQVKAEGSSVEARERVSRTPPITPEGPSRSAEEPESPVAAGSAWASNDRPVRVCTPESIAAVPELLDVWKGMEEREALYHIDTSYMQRHPSMRPRMRSLLADWLMEVAEEFGLHRETYHVALNMVDRYLSVAVHQAKSVVQLIGITCLFSASKIQEIFPPRLGKYADVTDGACTEADILAKELDIMQTLDWRLSPITPVSWLEVYLQACTNAAHPELQDFSMMPRYDMNVFAGVCKLLDFVTLDYSSIKFAPSVLTASALFLYASSYIDVTAVTGYDMKQLEPCIRWMSYFAIMLDHHFSRCGEGLPLYELPAEDGHLIQTHTTPYRLLDKVHQLRLRPLATWSERPSTPPS
eukprot:m.78589 g.78589  ORF g.78589 m.78589 type:complete len:449 (-) comp9227_c0_seq2:196-1542(-)